jgi:membrane protein
LVAPSKARSDPEGRSAPSPFAVPKEGWRQVLKRTWKEAGDDNIGIVAAGVAFYGFLALVPLLGAVVLSYGLVAEPTTVLRNVQKLTTVMPEEAAKLIGDQLMNVVKTSAGKKGFGVLVALAVALFGARNGAGAIIKALNIAYEEKETRGFIRLNIIALAITAATVLVAVIAIIAIAAMGHLETLVPQAPQPLLLAGKIASYLLLLIIGSAGVATLYRYAPNRQEAKWVWLTPGSLGASVLWIILTAAFGIYVANFGNYNATYGSLGAVVVLLTWLYLSSYVLLMGAELNSELERQTMRDTTSGPERPIGARGAKAADTVAGDPAEERGG